MSVRQRALLIGGVAGALIGVAAAFLYVKANEERIAAVEAGSGGSAIRITPASGLAIGLSVIGLLRQIVGLGKD